MRVVNNTLTSIDKTSYKTMKTHLHNKAALMESHTSLRVTRQIMRTLTTCAVVTGLLLIGTPNAFARSLDFADFQSTNDGGVEIRLSLSEDAPTPTDFTSKSPAKISLDIPKTDNNLPWSLPLPIDAGGVTDIKAVQSNNRTRVVVNMSELRPYKIRTEGSNIFIAVAGTGATTTAAAATPQPAAVPKPAAPEPRRTPPAAPAGVTQLQDITFTQLPGDKVQVKLSFNKPASEPGSFTIDNPARIALDFPNTSSGLGWKSKNVGIGFAKSITAVEAGNRTRVIINLVQLIPFETTAEGRNVILTLAGTRTAGEESSATSKVASVSTAVPGDSAQHMITNIDFRRGNKGEGRVVVTLSDADTPASTGESGQTIFVDFGNSGLPADLQQRLDVIDFATPVQYIDTTKVGNRVRLSITPAGEYEYLAYHAGNTYTIEVKHVEKKEEEKKTEEAGYTGEKLSLNFQDIEVRAVLQLIADFTNLNMVTSDSVSGNVTLRLKNVPWDQALDIVLKTKGLAMRKSGNVILVAPSEEINAREKMELESKKQIETLEPLKSELLQINYAKAKEIATLLKSQGTSVMSERGSTTVDDRTNTILAVDTADRLLEVRKLISKLDIPVRQVLIESRIVIANNDFAKDLGVRFGVSNIATANDPENLFFSSGSINATDTMASSAMDNFANSASPYPIEIPTGTGGFPQRLNVNMPVTASGAGRFALGILTSNTLLDLELSALQTDGRGEVISNPRVITANQKEAIIQQGTEIPYQEASSSGATSVSFKEAVLQLKVTPQITPDDRIILDLNVSKDSVGAVYAGVPSINTKEVQTQVLVDNGQTVVLGGIYEQEKVNSTSRIPFLGDLPWIGALFRNTHETNNKVELLIFVTPKILKQGLSEATK